MAPGSNSGGEQGGNSTSTNPPDSEQRGRHLQPPQHSPGLKRQAHRAASRSRTRSAADGMAAENGSAEPNEHTHLLRGLLYNSEGRPYYEDDRAYVKYPADVAHKIWLILSNNYVNVALVFVPLGIVAGLVGWDPTTIFILNFLAIIPLASLLSFATEQLAVPMGQTLGGLMNATFGNAVELIVCFLHLASLSAY